MCRVEKELDEVEIVPEARKVVYRALISIFLQFNEQEKHLRRHCSSHINGGLHIVYLFVVYIKDHRDSKANQIRHKKTKNHLFRQLILAVDKHLDCALLEEVFGVLPLVDEICQK